MNGTYDAAFSAKHPTAPMLAINIPANAGPKILERLNWVVLRASAGGICSGFTIEGTIELKDGMESASVMPTIRESEIIIHGCIEPVSKRMTIRIGHNIWIDWNIAITRRRSARSAKTPPISVKSQTGAFMAKLSSPTRNDDAPRLRSSQG